VAVSITNNLVPVIPKAQYDDEATDFLTKYCPEALAKPMPVPIERIATIEMGLTVLEHRLSEDFSILGQMCFTSGLAEIYARDECEYREIEVKRGTMIIDPDTYELRNIGCKNNTMAHESYHWFRHRNYHILRSVLDGKRSVALRCPVEERKQRADEPDDEYWMELQANGIAPRILMPKQTVATVFERLKAESQRNLFVAKGLTPAASWIAEQLAAFYMVSKQSAQIRLSELGLMR
jgi:hypothetical protein